MGKLTNEEEIAYTLGMLKVWAGELTEYIDTQQIERKGIANLKLIRVRNEIEEMTKRIHPQFEMKELLTVNGYSDDLKMKISDGQGGTTNWLQITEDTYSVIQGALKKQAN